MIIRDLPAFNRRVRLVWSKRRFFCPESCIDTGVVYHWCMSRTNIDLDEEACRSVMERYHFSTKRDAVNFALRLVAAEPLDLEASRALRGSGWEGDLEEMRAGRSR